MHMIFRLLADTKGASAAEYALLLGVCGASIVLAALFLGESVSCSIDRSATVIEQHTPGNTAPNNPC